MKKFYKFRHISMIKHIIILLALILICIPSYSFDNSAVSPVEKVRVYFSPNGGAQNAIVNSINAAKQEIMVMAYSFTSYPIANALIKAHKRGVEVIVIFDYSQLKNKHNRLRTLQTGGVKVFIDKEHAIAHNKTMIIDKFHVISGSYNFTNAAEKHNSENVLILDSAELANKYLENFNQHLEHSTANIKQARSN